MQTPATVGWLGWDNAGTKLLLPVTAVVAGILIYGAPGVDEENIINNKIHL